MNFFIYIVVILNVLLLPATVFSVEKAPKIYINGQLADTSSRRTLATAAEQGTVAQLFNVQKRLVYKLLKELDIDKEHLSQQTQAALATPHTNNFKAFIAYSVGLDLTDKGRFREARAAFRKAAKLDPGFHEARRQERLSPFKRQSITEMSKRLVSSAQRQRFNGTKKKTKKTNKKRTSPVKPLPRDPSTPSTNQGAAVGSGSAPSANKKPSTPKQQKNADTPQTTAKKQTFAEKFDQTIGEITRLTDGVAALSKSLTANPKNAPALFKKAIANRMDTDIALETVLSEMRGVGKTALKQVLDSAVANGLNPREARRVVKQLRSSGGCR